MSMQIKSLFFVTGAMIVVIGTALGFEHLGGYVPCALCLEQRTPYYIGIPVMMIGCLAAVLGWSRLFIRGALLIGFLCLLATALLGGYHAGVEWGVFVGPEGCGASISAQSSDAGDLLGSLALAKPPSCGEAAGRFLGISFAGWNVLSALFLAFIALKAFFIKPHTAG